MTDIAQRGNKLTRTGYAKGGRAGHAAGAIVKGGVKAGKRFLDFIKSGKHVDKHGVKVNVPKAAERLTGKPHVDHGKRKRIKHLGKGKAAGGRIGKAGGGALSFEHFGGGEKGKPHSSKEGRIAGGKQNIKRLMSKRKTWERPKLDKKRERKLQPYNKS